MLNKSVYDESDLHVLFANDDDLMRMFYRLKSYYEKYCNNSVVVNGYCWNGEDIIGVCDLDRNKYLFYVKPRLKQIVFENGHVLEFLYGLRRAVYQAAVSAVGYGEAFFPELAKPIVRKSNQPISSGNGVAQATKPNKSYPSASKKTSSKKTSGFNGPYERTGGGWLDDTWVPGLPSSRFYRSRKR